MNATSMIVIPFFLMVLVAAVGASAFPYDSTILTVGLAAVIVAIIAASAIPLINGQGITAAAKLSFFTGLWGAVSLAGYSGIMAIPYFGVILYFTFTAVYFIGAIQSIGYSGGGT